MRIAAAVCPPTHPPPPPPALHPSLPPPPSLPLHPAQTSNCSSVVSFAFYCLKPSSFPHLLTRLNHINKLYHLWQDSLKAFLRYHIHKSLARLQWPWHSAYLFLSGRLWVQMNVCARFNQIPHGCSRKITSTRTWGHRDLDFWPTKSNQFNFWDITFTRRGRKDRWMYNPKNINWS